MTKAGPPGDTQALPTGTWDSMSAGHVCQSFGCGRRSPSRSCCCLSVPPRDRGPLPSRACEPTGHSPPTGAPPHRGTGSVEEDEIPITQVPCAGVSGGCPALLAAVCRSSLLGRVTSGSGRCSMTPPPRRGGSQGRALPTARGTCAFSGPGSCGTGSVHSGRLNKPPRTDRPLATGRHAARKQHRGSLDAERGPRQDPDAPPRPCCLS